MSWHRIVVGIGNPGLGYENTRHNAGFMVLDEMASRMGLTFERLERRGPDGVKRFSGRVKAKVAEGANRQGEPFLLVKPQSYVNLSGEVVVPLVRHAQLPPESLFVVVDDLNLPLGRIRVRPSGSPGGHNGLKSIQQMLGSDGYPRLRLGIGESVETGRAEGQGPPVESDQWADFVLAPFLPEEREVLGRVLGRCADCLMSWLEGTDLPTLMNVYNRRSDGPEEPRDSGAAPGREGID